MHNIFKSGVKTLIKDLKDCLVEAFQYETDAKHVRKTYAVLSALEYYVSKDDSEVEDKYIEKNDKNHQNDKSQQNEKEEVYDWGSSPIEESYDKAITFKSNTVNNSYDNSYDNSYEKSYETTKQNEGSSEFYKPEKKLIPELDESQSHLYVSNNIDKFEKLKTVKKESDYITIHEINLKNHKWVYEYVKFIYIKPGKSIKTTHTLNLLTCDGVPYSTDNCKVYYGISGVYKINEINNFVKTGIEYILYQKVELSPDDDIGIGNIPIKKTINYAKIASQVSENNTTFEKIKVRADYAPSTNSKKTGKEYVAIVIKINCHKCYLGQDNFLYTITSNKDLIKYYTKNEDMNGNNFKIFYKYKKNH